MFHRVSKPSRPVREAVAATRPIQPQYGGTSFARLLAQTLFPSSSSSSSSSPGREPTLVDALRQRRLGRRSLASFSRADFAADATVQHCSLQITAGCAEWSAVDPALGDELSLLLLADSTAATPTNSSSQNMAGGGNGGATSLLDVDAASVIALPSPVLRTTIEEIRFIAGAESGSGTVSSNSTEETDLERQFINILTSTIVRSDGSAAVLLRNPEASAFEHHLAGCVPNAMIPAHLFPPLLAYSSPSVCVDLIERDASARLRFISSGKSSSPPLSSLHEPPSPPQERAPIDPVLFLRLFGALLRNPSLSREQFFVAGHRALLTLVDSYSVQLPSSAAIASDLLGGLDGPQSINLSDGGGSASSSSSSLLKNVVAVLLIRVSRLYGRSARALEFAELHRSLCDGPAAWLIQLAPTLYWTWLLGATLDAARSNSDVGFARLLPPFMSPRDARARDLDIEALARLWGAFVPHMEQAVAVAARFSDDACRKVRTTCIRVAVLLDESDDIVGSSSSSVSSSSSGHSGGGGGIVSGGSRVAVARKMGVPLSFQRLLHVYSVWGHHSIFSSASNTSSKSSSSNFSQQDSNLLDPKDAVSQTIRLFGVALRRGAGPLAVEHPDEYQTPLFAFMETVLADKPFAVIESTSYLLQLLADRFEALDKMILAGSQESCASEQLLQFEREKAGLTALGRRAADWAAAVLKAQGGGWDLATISPVADALERLGAAPRSPFWWRCGCGARNPSASIRCTMCLRRDAASSSHWTCPGKGCGARQFIEWYRLRRRKPSGKGKGGAGGDGGGDDGDGANLKAEHVKARCVACGSQHPWLTELERLRDSFVACSRCLEVQPPPPMALASSSSSTLAPVFMDLCGSGRCKTLQTPTTAASSSSSSDPAKKAESKQQQRSSSSSNRWQCPECSTSTTSPVACPGCGLLKDASQSDTRMWCCDDCGSWNFAGIARCHRFEFCHGRKKSSQRPIPYVRWRCGCGAFNPMWRIGCGKCCGKQTQNLQQKQQQQQPRSREEKRSQATLYTCPSCRTVPPRLAVRHIAPAHPMRPGMKLVSCGHCGADHPRDTAIVRSLHFERPCVSCGDWHTLPGFSPTAALSKKVCCAHCSCESDSAAEPFSRWSCETCSYEESKKRKTEALRSSSSSASSSSSGAAPTKDYCWRTGFRCSVCGDLHPSLAFSVVRTGIAARAPSSVYDAVFLWKCQAPLESNKEKQRHGSSGDDEDGYAAEDEQGLCCGAFNPSWETHCKSCGHMRFQPAASSSSSSSSSSRATSTVGEIRARYIPWSCDSCQDLQAPEEVVQCPSCFHPRVPPACLHCGQHHISLVCPTAHLSSSKQAEGKQSALQY